MFFFKKKRTLRPVQAGKVIGVRQSRGGKQVLLSRIIYWIILFLFVGVVVFLLFFSSFLTISKIQISGNEKIGPEAVQRIVDGHLSGKYWGLFPAANLILADKTALADEIKSSFKQIDDVQISKNFPAELEISIREWQTALTLCSGGECFAVDRGGVAYARIAELAGTFDLQGLPMLIDASNSAVAVGKTISNADALDFILNFAQRVNTDLGIPLTGQIQTPTLMSGDLRYQTRAGWTVYADQNIPLEKETEMLRIVLDKIRQSQNKLDDLEYIDVRTDNKVYYKFKNVEQQQENNPVPETEKNTKDESKKSKKT